MKIKNSYKNFETILPVEGMRNPSGCIVLLLFLFTGFCSQLQAQTLTISSSGETGTTGTNWSTSGSNPVIIQTTGEGDANVNVSVITGYLNNGTSVTVTSGTDIRLSNDINKSGGSACHTFI